MYSKLSWPLHCPQMISFQRPKYQHGSFFYKHDHSGPSIGVRFLCCATLEGVALSYQATQSLCFPMQERSTHCLFACNIIENMSLIRRAFQVAAERRYSVRHHEPECPRGPASCIVCSGDNHCCSSETIQRSRS
jgi:hypothetical protein